MRWGVRDEASNDHTTTEIVLEQVQKSRNKSKGPFFVVSKFHIKNDNANVEIFAWSYISCFL